MLFKTYLFILWTVACVNAKTHVFQMDQAPLGSNKDQVIQDVFRQLLSGPNRKHKQMAVNGFSWKDCGSQAVSISTLSLQPDPLEFPGIIKVSAVTNVKQALKGPLKAELKVEKEVLGFYVEIPCIDNVGSCTYDDVCTMLGNIKPCPQQLIEAGIDCKCPIQMKSYKVEDVSIPVPGSEAIVSGNYKVQASILQGTTKAMCLEVTFRIA